jgi:hypothetical protein
MEGANLLGALGCFRLACQVAHDHKLRAVGVLYKHDVCALSNVDLFLVKQMRYHYSYYSAIIGGWRDLHRWWVQFSG